MREVIAPSIVILSFIAYFIWSSKKGKEQEQCTRPTFDDFLSTFPPTYYLDQKRKEYVKINFKILGELADGKLVDRNRFRQLLLGKKAVGKSSLLSHLVEGVKKYFPEVTPLIISYNGEDELPSQLISEKFGLTTDPKSTRKRIENLEDYLTTNNIKLFLVIDEFQLVYQKENGKKIIEEIAVIGDSPKGNIHCILTGSSSILRLLCFAKLPESEKQKYPAYSYRDLNSTKYQPHWIYPFQKAEDFRGLLAALSIPTDGDRLAETYIRSGGYPGLVHGTGPSLYTLSAKGYLQKESTESKILRKMCDALSIILKGEKNEPNQTDPLIIDEPDQTDPLDSLLKYTQKMSFTILQDSNDNLPAVYNLADQGLINYYDGDEKKVCFASAHQYLEFLADDGISVLDLSYLRAATVDAEDPTLRCLAKSAKSWLSQDIVNTTIQKLHLPKPTDSKIEKFDVCVLYKETYGNSEKDCFGNDGVVITYDNEKKTWTVHAIQLKLGTTTWNEKTIEKPISRWNEREKDCQAAYQKLLGLPAETQVTINRYFVTTKPFQNEKVKKKIEGIATVLDAQFLSDNVWPQSVKKLGKPFNYDKVKK